MVDFMRVMKGNGIWLVGMFAILVLQHIASPLINIFADSTQGLMWFGVYIIWFIVSLVLPLSLMITGMVEQTDNHPFVQSLLAVVYGLICLGLLVMGNFMIGAFSNMFINQIALALFWISAIAMISINLLGIPIYSIIEAKKQ